MSSQRWKVFAGSFVGALVIHGVMIACGSMPTRGDGGSDVIVPRDIANAVMDSEVQDVRADPDAGACTCVPAPYVSTFALTVDEGSGAQTPDLDYSSGAMSVRPSRFSSSETGTTLFLSADFFVGGRPIALSSQIEIGSDRTLRRVVYAQARTDTCSPDSTPAVIGTLAVTSLEEHRAELRVSELTVFCRPDPTRDAGAHSIRFTNVVFRVESPGENFVSPPRRYQP